jgi:transcriptional regulator with XRE-family HTH domain
MAPKRRRQKREQQYESAFYKDLQERLKVNVLRLRKKNGWSQEEAAWQCHMPTRLFQQIEAGDANATLTTIARLAHGFEIDVGKLFRRGPMN